MPTEGTLDLAIGESSGIWVSEFQPHGLRKIKILHGGTGVINMPGGRQPGHSPGHADWGCAWNRTFPRHDNPPAIMGLLDLAECCDAACRIRWQGPRRPNGC